MSDIEIDQNAKEAARLSSIFNPKSICVVGASPNLSSVNGQLLRILQQHRYPGPITAVNPKYDSINGVLCVESVEALPAPVDVAVVALRAELVPAVITDCARKGIRSAIVISSGLSVIPGCMEKLRAVVAESGIRLLGPNSQGVWSTPSHAVMTHGTAAALGPIQEGSVSILSQSGSIGAAIARRLQERGIGCRYFASLGDEIDIDVSDCIEFILNEGSSNILGLFLEGVRYGSRFARLLARASEQNVRVVAMKSGNSLLGAQATFSHTGKLATTERVYDGVFAQFDVLAVHTTADLLDALTAVACTHPKRVTLGIGVVSASGGCRAPICDAAERLHVPLATFDELTVDRLRDMTEPLGYGRNPVDVPIDVLYDNGRFQGLLECVLRDRNCDGLLVQYANRGVQQVSAHQGMLSELARRWGKPIAAGLLYEMPPPKVRADLGAGGVLCATGPEEAVKLLAWTLGVSGAGAPHRSESIDNPAMKSELNVACGSWLGQVSFLEACGVEVPRWMSVSSDSERAAAMIRERLGLPVVLKAFPDQADHKADRGLVKVGLRSEEEITSALSSLREELGRAPVLAQAMVLGGVEVLVGVHHDRDFGPTLSIGSGGHAVELLADVTHLVLPASPDEIARAFERLVIGRVLLGIPWTGGSSALDAVAIRAHEIAVCFSRAVPRLSEVEINPLIVLGSQRRLLAVDILTKSAQSGSTVGVEHAAF